MGQTERICPDFLTFPRGRARGDWQLGPTRKPPGCTLWRDGDSSDLGPLGGTGGGNGKGENPGVTSLVTHGTGGRSMGWGERYSLPVS